MNIAFLQKNWKTILTIIVVIILVIIIYRNWYKIKRLFQGRDLDLEPGENLNISPERTKYLENLAILIYADIYDTPITGHKSSLYEEANALTDNELLFVSRYYKRQLSSGVWLYDDLEDEVFASDVDTKLMTHLAKIGER